MAAAMASVRTGHDSVSTSRADRAEDIGPFGALVARPRARRLPIGVEPILLADGAATTGRDASPGSSPVRRRSFF